MSEKQIFNHLCINDFGFFLKQALKVIEPETEFEWNFHMDEMCRVLQEIEEGKYREVDFNVPPRTLKTLIISVSFPCWVWLRKPETKFLSASSSYELANKINIKRRELIESDFYQGVKTVKIKDYRNRIDLFENVYNGFMQSVSAGGKITGAGADYLLSDDLIDAKDAFSKASRNTIRNWYSNAYYNRAQNRRKVKRINVNQRLHKDDISGLIREKYNFERFVLEMVKTDKELGTIEIKDPRELGELLHPRIYNDLDLNQDKRSLGTFGYSAQLQQDPTSPDGGIVKKSQLRYYKPDKHLSYEKKIITGDLNKTGDSSGDYCVFACWGKSGTNKYLIDMVRGKWSYKITKEKFKDFCNKHNAIHKYIENQANGPALISDLKDEIKGIIAWPLKKSGLNSADKVTRMHLVSTEFENGNVYINEELGKKDDESIGLLQDYEEELLGFSDVGSGTGHDDMVDTTTMALIELKKSGMYIG